MELKTEFELRKSLKKMVNLLDHDHVEVIENCPLCIALDALAGEPEHFMDAEEYYREIISPINYDKEFIPPTWVIDFAEKYADYKATAFYRLKLRLEYENWAESARKILNQIDDKP